MLLPNKKIIIINGEILLLEKVAQGVSSLSEGDGSIKAKVNRFLAEWADKWPTLRLQTSGSTGKPKEIFVAKSNMVASAMMTGRLFNLKENHTALLCLSPDFVAGKMMIVRAIELKLNLIISKDFGYPLDGVNQMVNFAAMVPLQVSNMLKKDPKQLQKIQKLIIGGSSISSALESQLQGVKTNCWHTYAMTETLSHVALRKINGPGRSEWFKPLPGVLIELDDRGCIVIEAPKLAPEKVVTNDIAILKGNKFKILGRYDEAIISAGNKLHPALIERKLEQVLSVPFFIGAEDNPLAGQNPVLYIQAKADDFDLDYLGKQFGSLLEKAEIPRKVIFKPEFHYLESGKIDKAKTKAS